MRAPPRLPLSMRLGWGVVCGAAALALNQVPAPILSPESPEFALGGAFVLFAFWQLGPLPGLVAAAIGYLRVGALPEITLLAVALYSIEGFVASHVSRRTRSLVVADVLFWLTAGALLDALAYWRWMGLSGGYVLLLVVKQLLNGVMNSVVADGIASVDAVRGILGVPPTPPRSWQQVLFDRAVPLVMVPTTVIGLLLARSSHAAALNQTAADLRHTATSAEANAARFLQSRFALIQALREHIELEARLDPVRAGEQLTAFLAAHTELFNVFVTDARGIVVAAAPQQSKAGERYIGRDLSRRPYFTVARAENRAVFGELVLGQLHVRRPGIEPIIPLAVPLNRADGAFSGVVMAALDAGTLQAILAASAGNPDFGVQLLDRERRVVASTSPLWRVGAPRAPELADSSSGPLTIKVRHNDSYADALGVAPRVTVTQGVSLFPFTVLVDVPMTAVHRALVPTSLSLVALMLIALLIVYAVARTLGAQLVAPLRSVGEAAEDLADGHTVPRETLERFDASGVDEIRTLGAQFQRMDQALRTRREADASAVQRSESKYRETLEQLVQAQKMEGIGRLAGGIAHDFNNLLTPILGYTDLALGGVPEGSPARKDLTLVRTAAGRAKEVVAQLLAFGRAQVLDTTRIDLAEVVAEFEPLLRRSLVVSCDLMVIAEPGIVVDADRAKVQQVLMNLVLNAADAMPSGGRVEVRVGLEEHTGSGTDAEPMADGYYGVIAVRDTGVGMDEETRRRAFDPFFTTKPRGKGTGLGLSMAYGIARQHRGTIVVESNPGHGTIMRVLLPIAPPTPHSITPATDGPEIPVAILAGADGATATVLVVEDESSVRDLVRVALGRAGYRVLAARDGDEALTRSAAHEGRIDLLLTDVVMPGLNGREVAQRFRAVRPDARVLFMSGYAADVIAEEGALVGDAELLVKPFTPDELAARVREALGR